MNYTTWRVCWVPRIGTKDENGPHLHIWLWGGRGITISGRKKFMLFSERNRILHRWFVFGPLRFTYRMARE